MKDKILSQVMDHLRGWLSLSPGASLEVALKILAWAKLLPGDLFKEPMSAERLRATLEMSGYDPILLQQAFPDESLFERLEFAGLRSSLEMVHRLREQGLLQAFDPSDALTIVSDGEMANCAVPPELATFLVGLAGIKPHETVYVPWDLGAQLASRCARQATGVYLETPQVSSIPALVSVLGEKSFTVQYADPIRAPSAVEGGRLCPFDVAVACPPFGLRYDLKALDRDWFARFPERTSSGTILAIRHLLAQARRCVVVAVPNALLFGPHAEQRLRQDLLRKGQLAAVVAMPSRLGVFGSISAPLAVLVLDPIGGHEHVNFINADIPEFREPTSKARQRLTHLERLIREVTQPQDPACSAKVPVSEVLANDAQLQVERYVLPERRKRLAAILEHTPTCPLDELVTTVRPMKTVTEDETDWGETLEVGEIGTADLPAYGFIRAPSRSVKVAAYSSRKVQQQFLQPLDILLILKGNVGKVGLVPPDVPPPGQHGSWIAGGSAIILRGLDSAPLDARLLFLQLRAPIGQELLNSIVSGASIPLIQIKELNRLPILLPDPATVHQALRAFEQEIALQQQIEVLQARQAQLTASLWSLDDGE